MGRSESGSAHTAAGVLAKDLGRGQVVRHRSLEPVFEGSNPSAPVLAWGDPRVVGGRRSAKARRRRTETIPRVGPTLRIGVGGPDARNRRVVRSDRG